jgi:hypothetical protein
MNTTIKTAAAIFVGDMDLDEVERTAIAKVFAHNYAERKSYEERFSIRRETTQADRMNDKLYGLVSGAPNRHPNYWPTDGSPGVHYMGRFVDDMFYTTSHMPPVTIDGYTLPPIYVEHFIGTITNTQYFFRASGLHEQEYDRLLKKINSATF